MDIQVLYPDGQLRNRVAGYTTGIRLRNRASYPAVRNIYKLYKALPFLRVPSEIVKTVQNRTEKVVWLRETKS